MGGIECWKMLVVMKVSRVADTSLGTTPGPSKRAARVHAGEDAQGVSDRQDTRISSNYPRPGE